MGLPLNDGGYTPVATDCGFCGDWKRDHIRFQRKHGFILICPSNNVEALYEKDGVWPAKLTADELRIVALEIRCRELKHSLWLVKEELSMRRGLYKESQGGVR